MPRELNIEIQPNNRCVVSGTLPKTVLIKALSFRKKGFQFSPSYKKGYWDGFIHLYDEKNRSFPTGLLDMACDAAEAWAEKYGRELVIDIVDEETFPEFTGKDFDIRGITPRDYQIEAAEKMIEEGRGIIKAATNAGKTAVTAMVLKRANLESIVLVPSKDLLHQTSADLEGFLGVKIGKIGDGIFDTRKITVAMPSTLIRRIAPKSKHRSAVLEYLQSIELVIADECHTLGAKTFEDVMKAIPAPCRFGMSGTPLYRSDGADMRLIAQTGEVIFEISNATLIENGFSLNAQIEFFNVKEPVLDKASTWQEAYADGIVNNEYRNTLIANTVMDRAKDGLQTLIIVKQIEHGENLEVMFPEAFKCVFVSGSYSTKERKAALDAFRAKKLHAIIATKIFDVGISINNIDVLVMAAGGKSKIETLQRLGRGVRTGGNSDKLYIIEFADLTHKYLKDHSRERLKTYQGEKCFEFIHHE